MAKSTNSKEKTEQESTNNANARKENQFPSRSATNASKYDLTDATGPELEMLDPEDGLRKLLLDCVKDLYWAENHLLIALPKMAAAASMPDLQTAILQHHQETATQVDRLVKVFQLLGHAPQARKCDAMLGLTMEGEAVIETTDPGTPARNLGIIMGSQKVEHYEMAAYTGLSQLATQLGETEVAAILQETLLEEQTSNDKLAALSQQL